MEELKRFVNGPKFWKAVWVVENSEEAINKYRSFFTEGKLKKLDIDGNGKVDDAELRGYSLQYIKEWVGWRFVKIRVKTREGLSDIDYMGVQPKTTQSHK